MNQADALFQGPSSADPVCVRPAESADLSQLEALVEQFVRMHRLLPRTAEELQDLIPFGFVACRNEQIVGFAALEIYSSKLAEVRSLLVLPELQKQGVGKQLVARCVELARSRNVLEVMAITSNEHFFQSCGFGFTLPGEKKALFIQTREHP